MARKKLKRQIRKAAKSGNKITRREIRRISNKTGRSPAKIQKALSAQKDKGVQIPKQSAKTIILSGGVRSQVRESLKGDSSVSKDELIAIAKDNPGLKAGQILRIAKKTATKKEGTIEAGKNRRIIKDTQVQSYLDKFAEGGIGAKELGKIYKRVGFKNTDRFLKRLDDLGVELDPKVTKRFKKRQGLADATEKAEELADKVDPFPGTGKTISSKQFRKYKPQSKEIRDAADAALEAALKDKERFKPTRLGKATKIKDKFVRKRDAREKKLDDFETKLKDKKPKFGQHQREVEKIRSGKGEKSEYAYSGRFENLGRQLGVRYGTDAREARTEKRFQRLTTGLKSTYETPAVTRERRRKLGNQAIQSLKMN
tara:strand:+ start:1555 stop:2664 length:1110 start_codon:yes stop_codon:yes gene_type:complete